MQRWGAPWWAPFLFLALSFSAPAGAEQGVWRDADIRHSGIETQACEAGAGQAASLAGADLVLAVREAGHELLVLDAATLATLGRCRLPQALQGTPLRSPDGRFVFAAAADGWVLRLDLQQFGALQRTRTGLALSGLALSADGRWLLAGHTRPHSLVLLDAQLQLVRSYRTMALTGGADSAVAGVWHSETRRSFVVAFETLPELWELSYNPTAEPIYDGLVHDYRMAEAIATAGFLGVRRTPLPQPLQVLLADTSLRHLLVTPSPQAAPAAASGATTVEILNLDIRRRITSHALPGRPAPWAGVAYTVGDASWLALPTQPQGRVVLMEAGRWQLHPERLATLRGVDTVRSHPAVTQLWLHATVDASSDTVLLLDKTDLHLVTTLREAGRRWAPVSFAAGGRRAVLATREAQGDVRLLDTATLRELRRVALAQVEAVYALDGPRPAPARD
jgi:hypothetical protein